MPEASQTSLPHLTCPSRRVERKGRKLRFLGSAPRPVRVRSGAMDQTTPCSTQGLKIWKLLLSHVLSLEGATVGRHGVAGHRRLPAFPHKGLTILTALHPLGAPSITASSLVGHRR